MVLVQLIPRFINYAAVSLAGILLLIAGILILANQTNGW